MTNLTSILLVEDSIADAKYVQQILPGHLYSFVHVTRLEQAQKALASGVAFDVILLDLTLPDETGISTVTSTMAWAGSVPIVILTGLSDEDISIQAVKCGAQDYILKKEISEHSLARTIRYAVERKLHEKTSKRLAVLEQHEEFMATLTHDLKNPLIGSNLILEMMAEQAMGEVSDEQVSLLLKLRDSNTLLISMIQNLIEVYRFEKDVNAVQLENTNLLQIMNSCIGAITPIAEHRHIQVSTKVPESLKEVVADARALHRVMQNLLDNALKFTPSGGQISVEIRATNGSVAIDISDSGPGIPQDEQKSLFERFSQGRIGKKFTPGTGLGLFLCKQIMDAHKGEITCLSSTKGTTFTLKVPAA